MIQKRNIAFPDHIYTRKMNKKTIQLKVALISYNWDISICPCSIIAPRLPYLRNLKYFNNFNDHKLEKLIVYYVF